MSELITYEQPLNERIRTFLRLEFLFARVDNGLAGKSEIDQRNAIDAMLSILSVFERSDLKSEIAKEIERLIANLSALEQTPGVDKKMLDSLLDELDQTLDGIYLQKSAIGQSLRDNEFLYSIRQRSSMPGGTCDFDIPGYHYWLQHTPLNQRIEQINAWMNQFTTARNAIEIALRLTRESISFSEQQAENGFYQRSLDSSLPTQMIRIMVPADAHYFPEISGGKHRFTVRFMNFDVNSRPQQIQEDVTFLLSCCTM